MADTNLLTIREVAAEAGVSHWTIRRYLTGGVLKGFRDDRGQIWLKPDTPQKAREHLFAHGGPGGRPLPQ